MPIVTFEEAVLQLNIIDEDQVLEESTIIESMISAAIGMVEHMLQRDIYEEVAEVPESTTNAIVFNELKATKQSALKMAIMLVISTLYIYREADLDTVLTENPALTACLSGFNSVVVG
jgi:hypothetical protein